MKIDRQRVRELVIAVVSAAAGVVGAEHVSPELIGRILGLLGV